MDEKRTWIGALLSQRQVIPRWHSPQSALDAGERDSTRTALRPRVLSPRWIPLLQEQAEREKSDSHVRVELEEMRFIQGLPREDEYERLPFTSSALLRAQQVWQQVAEHAGVKPPPRPQLSARWREDEQLNVARMRASLARYPQQPLLWSELARTYIVLREDAKARKAMACAIQLASRSTYIRRCAARMFLHLQDTPSALRVVREHPNFRGEPRLLSAEIAISARTASPLRFAKLGLQMLDDAKYRPTSLSELSAALATVELEFGKHKRSRALFVRSMIEPSENALAQIQWATERDRHIVIPTEAWQISRPYEARAMFARLEGNWDEVLNATELWLQEEPFATRPGAIGSFASFSREQNERAERLASQALLANPQSATLHNNRSVARAYLGDLSGALEDVKTSVGCSSTTHPYLTATLGLIAYRAGDHVLGALGYKAALAHFVKQKNAPSAMLGSLFWLRELVRIGDPSAPADLEYIKRNLLRFTGGKPEPEIQSMLRLIEGALAQGELPIPVESDVVFGDARNVFERFEPSLEIPDLRGRFFEHL